MTPMRRTAPKRPTRLALALLGVVAAWLGAACAPASTAADPPRLAVFAVPVDARVPGAAADLDARLRRADLPFDLAPAATLRFLEVRSGLLDGSLEAAVPRLARRTGAAYALTVRGAVRERELVTPEVGPAVETATVRLRLQLVDAEDGRIVRTWRGPTRTGRRTLEASEGPPTLPPWGDDPLVRDLAREGLDALAPDVVRDLASRAALRSTDE
jgi:hypothetical protein